MRENARPGAALLYGKSIARRAATKRNGEDKPMMGTDIAIDLGTANFKLFVDGRGVVINEPKGTFCRMSATHLYFFRNC